jgi:hypothetical protein
LGLSDAAPERIVDQLTIETTPCYVLPTFVSRKNVAFEGGDVSLGHASAAQKFP